MGPDVPALTARLEIAGGIRRALQAALPPVCSPAERFEHIGPMAGVYT